MKKALLYGDNSLLAQVLAEYKDLCRFMPVLYICEGVNSEVVINSLIKNIDLDKINKLEVNELLQHFELHLLVGNLTPVLKKYESAFKGISPEEENFKAKRKFNIHLESEQDYEAYVFICETVRKLRAYGFRVAISTDTPSFKKMVCFMRQDNYADIELFFSEKTQRNYSVGITESVLYDNCNILVDILLKKCKHSILKNEWIERDFKIFKTVDFANMHFFVYQNKYYLFKSCNRSTFEVPAHLKKLVEAYYAGDLAYLAKCTYQKLFEFSEMRYYEREKSYQFETLFTLPYLKIENINDVILSYLGARKCNLACEYCFSDHTIKEFPPLPKQEVIKIADYVLKGNQNIKLHIDNYIGGEPCLDFETVQDMYYTMFRYHKAYGIDASFGFLSNGTALTEEHLAWLRNNVPYVGFSLDGDEVTNDMVRHDSTGKGSYESVKNAIQKIRDMDWPVEIGISCVLTANNVNIKDLFLHFIDELGVNNVVIKPVRAPETSKIALTMKNIDSLKNGYKELFDFLYKKAKAGDIKYLKSMLMPLDYAGRFFIRTFLQDRVVVKRCGSGEHIFSVGNDACIYGCDSFNGTRKAFLADTRKGIFSHKYSVPFVTQERFGCKDCWARFMCGGVCQYVQYVNNYKENSVTKFECELAKFLIEEAIGFWAAAYNEFSAETLEEIAKHIENIGFSKYKNRDSFYYAPC